MCCDVNYTQLPRCALPHCPPLDCGEREIPHAGLHPRKSWGECNRGMRKINPLFTYDFCPYYSRWITSNYKLALISRPWIGLIYSTIERPPTAPTATNKPYPASCGWRTQYAFHLWKLTMHLHALFTSGESTMGTPPSSNSRQPLTALRCAAHSPSPSLRPSQLLLLALVFSWTGLTWAALTHLLGHAAVHYWHMSREPYSAPSSLSI